jgi:GT2 family glycosyltransferase
LGEGVILISVSIISHGHGAMAERLVESLLKYCPEVTEIFVTRNIPELLAIVPCDRVILIDNIFPKGFAENHNAAFRLCGQPFFCPLNPDIELTENPFPGLLLAMNRTGAELVAPIVRKPGGSIDDSVRSFPTLFSLARKAFGGDDGRYLVVDGQAEFHPEWVAGMFMLFNSPAFARLGGFDERFFLYYEDVDICARAWKQGMKITACPKVSVIHDARRDSHRNPVHLCWHLASMARYFWKHWGRLPIVPGGRSLLG